MVTDLKLPDGTGLDVERLIHGRHRLPIIMITSYSSIESAIAALRAGAVDYIIKPFNNDELLHAVARALDRRRAAPLPGGTRPLAIEDYIREVIERFQDSTARSSSRACSASAARRCGCAAASGD